MVAESERGSPKHCPDLIRTALRPRQIPSPLVTVPHHITPTVCRPGHQPYVQSEKNGATESIAECIVWGSWKITRKCCLGMKPFANRSVTTSCGAWILA